jgi:hypothetical protein
MERALLSLAVGFRPSFLADGVHHVSSGWAKGSLDLAQRVQIFRARGFRVGQPLAKPLDLGARQRHTRDARPGFMRE